MTPGNDAGRRSGGLSRRRLLAGIGGVGAVGMASGLGTGAYLSDRETFPNNAFGAGEVGLTVDGEPTDGTVTVGPLAVDRTTFDERPRPERFEVGASANPVRVWLATRCPDGDPLGDALEVEVVVDSESVTGGYRPLAEVERLLATGIRIDDGCLEAGPDGGSIAVEVAPYLPADSPDVGGETTDLTFHLYAEQCRHVTEAEANAPGANPFAEVVCEEFEEECLACVEFGKADDIEATLAVGDTLPLVGLPAGVGAHEIEITAVETKGGEAGETVGAGFALRGPDGTAGPSVCAVEIKGGQGTERHELDPPATETGEVLFAPLNPDNGERYGISHIVVFVCAGDGEDGLSDERSGDAISGENVDGDTTDENSSGKSGNGNGGGNGNDKPGNDGGKSGDGDTEEN
ncbi:SipW-dependent-type signal peptide-containing protein [Halorubrum xinjiangense]|uniref:SipW-dependent-type signal peptide-containing protein n=1 Tax=Halorubrum xinjiangense TaxID=261291 RepID=UPI003C6F1D81